MDVQNSYFNAKALSRDVKKYTIVTIFFFIALLFFFAGLFMPSNVIKFAAVALIIFGGLSVRMTWVQPTYLSERTTMFNLAGATSYSFLLLGSLLGLIFLIDLFAYHIANMPFAIFGSVVLSIIASSMYMAYKLRDYE